MSLIIQEQFGREMGPMLELSYKYADLLKGDAGISRGKWAEVQNHAYIAIEII